MFYDVSMLAHTSARQRQWTFSGRIAVSSRITPLISVVFWSSLIEAAGIPFPSRVILILTPAFLATERDLVRLIIVATIGALLGDHVPYTAGRVAGTRMLGLYCKVTIGSARCMERTLEYFRRFGAAALVLSRFSTSARIFTSARAGCGHITYLRYLAKLPDANQ